MPSISGLISPSPKRTVHKPSGKAIFVAYAYVNSDVAAKSQAFREETYALKRWINMKIKRRDVVKKRVCGPQRRKKKNDRAAYNRPMSKVKEGFVRLMPPIKLRHFPW